MLQYLNKRIYYKNFSFTIPDGYYIADVAEGDRENHMLLLPPDESFQLDASFVEDSATANEELTALSEMMDMCVLRAQSAVTVNGIYGAHMFYTSGSKEYYELWLNIPRQNCAFDVVISSKRNIFKVDVEGVLKALDIRAAEE